MERRQRLVEEAEELIEEGERVTARKLSQATGFHPADVHRLLNSLEKQGKIRSRTQELFGEKVRVVAVKR
ncbi:MAG: helix-turn-helix domain-containing protein [Candidatus Nanohaloarchaea archaeon]